MRLRAVCALAAVHRSAPFSAALRVPPRAAHALATSSQNAGAESYTLQKVAMPKDIEDTVVKPDGAAARQDLSLIHI